MNMTVDCMHKTYLTIRPSNPSFQSFIFYMTMHICEFIDLLVWFVFDAVFGKDEKKMWMINKPLRFH